MGEARRPAGWSFGPANYMGGNGHRISNLGMTCRRRFEMSIAIPSVGLRKFLRRSALSLFAKGRSATDGPVDGIAIRGQVPTLFWLQIPTLYLLVSSHRVRRSPTRRIPDLAGERTTQAGRAADRSRDRGRRTTKCQCRPRFRPGRGMARRRTFDC
jgi:hypothetical protein